jgi:Ca-activated chloride channel family protein
MIFRFLHPWLFAALLVIPLIILFFRWIEQSGRPRIVFSDLSAFKEVPPSARVQLRHLGVALRCLAIAAIITALARPQYGNQMQEIMSKGIDIMIVLDTSTSMKQSDMEPNRLAAAKAVSKKFVEGREESLQNDRIGLVVFSAIAFTQCPLTVDYTILKKIVSRVQFTKREFDGTAIGTALATAVGRIKDSKAKSKVVILVTDGENNRGLDPMTAASVAKAMGVKVYTIGVVPEGLMQKVQDKIFGVHLIPSRPAVDETQMQEIAKSTGGRYFKAKDEEALAKIFEEIDKLEKTEVKVKEFYRYTEAYAPWAGAALLLILLEMMLGKTVFRRLP